MKIFHLPSLEREDKITFRGIPKGQFEETVSAIDRKLRKKMRANEIRESQSIRFASEFVSVPPPEDE